MLNVARFKNVNAITVEYIHGQFVPVFTYRSTAKQFAVDFQRPCNWGGIVLDVQPGRPAAAGCSRVEEHPSVP